MPEPPRLTQYELMFVEDLTLVDDLNQMFHRAHALVNTVAELIGEPPYVPITMARASALAEIAIDLLEQGEWTVDEWWERRRGEGKPRRVEGGTSHDTRASHPRRGDPVYDHRAPPPAHQHHPV